MEEALRVGEEPQNTQDNSQTNESGSSVGSESSILEFSRDTVSKFVRDVSEGKFVLNFDQKKLIRPEDAELVSNTLAKMFSHLSEYASGTKAGEELAFVERQLFFCISVLRTYGVLQPNLNESRIEQGILRVESRVDSIRTQIDEIVRRLSVPIERSQREESYERKPVLRKKRKTRPHRKRSRT